MTEWEKVNSNTKRLKVFNGWIVKTEENVYDNIQKSDPKIIQTSISQIFITDPEHEWKLE